MNEELKDETTREPSMLPYLAIAAVIVTAMLAGMTAVVEKAAIPLEAHVARSMGMEPSGETAFARNEQTGNVANEPFRPRS